MARRDRRMVEFRVHVWRTTAAGLVNNLRKQNWEGTIMTIAFKT